MRCVCMQCHACKIPQDFVNITVNLRSYREMFRCIVLQIVKDHLIIKFYLYTQEFIIAHFAPVNTPNGISYSVEFAGIVQFVNMIIQWNPSYTHSGC